jgi:hypothetical protein
MAANNLRKIAIDPVLPREYYVTMGTAVKYLSSLKRRFWIGEGRAPTATSDQFGVTWEGTDNRIAEPGKDVELSLFAGGPIAESALDEFETVEKLRSAHFMPRGLAQFTTAMLRTAHRNRIS